MRRRIVALMFAAAVCTPVPMASAEPASGKGAEDIDYQQWDTSAEFARGEPAGVAATAHGLRISHPVGTLERTEPELGTTRTYEYGQWTSPEYQPGFGVSELVASWNADTPPGTWLQVEVSGTTSSGADTGWYVLGQWAHGDADIHRTSVPGQSNSYAQVNVDTLAVRSGMTLDSYQLRVRLYRAEGSTATPVLRSAGAMSSNVPDRFEVPISEPGVATGIELPVPRYAQNIHAGNYPQYGGGGESWCSPTSTEMVVEYWGKGPTEEDMSWIRPGYTDPSVAHAARYTYDYSYEGTGNWSFNAAYAAHYGLEAHVTRLHSLAELETYIARGIPVITSQSFLESELDGAGYGTAGHLMVVVGFTADGDVIANDPAADSNANVRNVYPREQFETIWQRTKRYDADGEVAGGTGGIAYIITPLSSRRPSA